MYFPADASEGSRNIKLADSEDGTCLRLVMSQRAYLDQFDRKSAFFFKLLRFLSGWNLLCLLYFKPEWSHLLSLLTYRRVFPGSLCRSEVQGTIWTFSCQLPLSQVKIRRNDTVVTRTCCPASFCCDAFRVLQNVCFTSPRFILPMLNTSVKMLAGTSG